MDLWVDTERPKTLDDIKGQDRNVTLFRHFLETKQVPNLLLYGPKGTCKTSTILAFCRDLYGEDYRSHTIELNASHERGINDVRNKIKKLSKQKAKREFKFIILDEADSMTKDAMFALRMIMEDYVSITRFCLICNYPYKIIKPITSRCITIYFPPIDNQVIAKCGLRLTGVDMNRDVESSGDLRKYLLRLQCYGDLVEKNSHTKELWDRLLTDNIYDIVKEIESESYNMQVLIEDWMERALVGGHLGAIDVLSLVHHRVVTGCDPVLQSYHLVSELQNILMEH